MGECGGPCLCSRAVPRQRRREQRVCSVRRQLPDLGYTAPESSAPGGPDGAATESARRLENGNLARFSRCLERGGVWSVRAGGLGRQFRRYCQSSADRCRGGGTSAVSHSGRSASQWHGDGGSPQPATTALTPRGGLSLQWRSADSLVSAQGLELVHSRRVAHSRGHGVSAGVDRLAERSGGLSPLRSGALRTARLCLLAQRAAPGLRQRRHSPCATAHASCLR